MSISLLLTITASSIAVILFADKATQWSLRLLLGELADHRRALADVEEVVVKTEDEATVSAQAA
jgi:hypothetical protein